MAHNHHKREHSLWTVETVAGRTPFKNVPLEPVDVEALREAVKRNLQEIEPRLRVFIVSAKEEQLRILID